MTEARLFPMLLDHTQRREIGIERCPRVPWAWLALHEEQAIHNHDQTLERLAARGGLDPGEMLDIVTGSKRGTHGKLPLAERMRRVNKLIAQWERNRC